MPPANLLSNRVILVTGAGDGIGRVAANSFAQHGASVILLGRTEEKLEAVYDEIEQQGWPKAVVCAFDLQNNSYADYQTLAAQIEAEFGRLDGLLHNASLLGKLTTIEQYEVQLWQQVMQVNINAAFLLTKATLPLLKLSADASVVFTSSSVGRKGRAYWGAYSVAKFATEGLMQVLADELEGTSTIRVNSINPGATRTAMRAKAYPGENPLDNPLPEAIMSAYLYLMGPDSKEVNGQAVDAQNYSRKI